MIPLGLHCDYYVKYLMISTLILTIGTSITTSQDSPRSCMSADEFAAPADGHCLPLKNCSIISSGPNTAKFRLILKALLCEGDLPDLENPKICCPDVKTNLIGRPTDVAKQIAVANSEGKNAESEENGGEESEDEIPDEISEFAQLNSTTTAGIPSKTELLEPPTPISTPVEMKMLRQTERVAKAVESFDETNFESRGESQEDEVTTTTTDIFGVESNTEKDLDLSGRITVGTNLATDATDYEDVDRTTVQGKTKSQMDYETGSAPSSL